MPMNMKKHLVLISVLLLSSCATATSFSAADDVRTLAIALRDGNYAAIESHIDKRALKAQAMQIARDVAIEEGAKQLGSGLGAQVASIAAVDALKPVIEALADRAIEPDALAFFARQAGVNENLQIPSRFRATLALKTINDGRVCVVDDKTKRCMLYFGKYENGWRLNGVDEATLRMRIKS